mgnify:CR=1 FL=1
MFGAFYKTFMSVRARERARARRRARATARGRRAGDGAREAATIERAIATTTGEGGARPREDGGTDEARTRARRIRRCTSG